MQIETEGIQYDGYEEAIPLAIMALLGIRGNTLRHVGSFEGEEDGMHASGEVYERVGAKSNHTHVGIMLITKDDEHSWRLVVFDREDDGTLTPHGCAVSEALLGIYTDTREEMLDLFDFRFEGIQA